MTSGTRCAACKHLRRRCPSNCVFSPYFPATNKQRFIDAHKIYGASNIEKMLLGLPVNLRSEAANALCYEAYCRRKDPVYGSVGVISVLQQQIHDMQSELAQVQAEMAVVAATAHAQADQQLLEQQQQVYQIDHPIFDGSFLPQLNEESTTAPYDPSTLFC